GARTHSPRVVTGPKRPSPAIPERARASSGPRPERRWRVSQSCAHPHLLAAVGANRSLGAIDPDTDRLAVAEVDDREVDAGPQSLRGEILEKAGLVLELLGDPLDGPGRHRDDAVEQLRQTARDA